MNRLRATSTSLVMLVAPAGYGKTTLAAQWAERERRPCAWLTVDESDDDAAVLLARLADALERIRPDDAPPVAPARRPKDWSTELQRLASRLSTLRDFVLVVDEAQLLRSRNATKVLATLAERVPAGSTLTLVGRLAPSLPIARLRADGRLLELRAADLALSRRESEALLRCLDAGLTDDDAAELVERCEGWAAGICLSALAAREHAGGLDHALPGGDDRFLAEYFRSEFLVPADGRAADVPPANIGARAPDRPGLRRRAEAKGLGPRPRFARAPAPARRPARPARRGVPLPPAVA